MKQVEGPASSQPDLNIVSLKKAEPASAQMENRQLKEQLLCCAPAMDLIRSHEEAMFADGIISKEKTFLPKLEKSLLEFGSQDVCQGLFYTTFYSHGEHSIARIIETGCFEGVSTDEECLSVLKETCSDNGLLLYEVYSKADITDTAIRVDERSRQLSLKRKKSDQAQLRVRSTERFKHQLQQLKPLLENLQTMATAGTCLKGGLLFLLKNSKNSHREDRFFHAFGVADQGECVEKTLHDFHLQETARTHQEEFSRRSVSADQSLQVQLQALSSLSNNPAEKLPGAYRGSRQVMIANPSLVQHFSTGFKERSLLPVSLRNRLIFFVTHKEYAEVDILLPYIVGNITEKSLTLDTSDEGSSSYVLTDSGHEDDSQRMEPHKSLITSEVQTDISGDLPEKWTKVDGEFAELRAEDVGKTEQDCAEDEKEVEQDWTNEIESDLHDWEPCVTFLNPADVKEDEEEGESPPPESRETENETTSHLEQQQLSGTGQSREWVQTLRWLKQEAVPVTSGNEGGLIYPDQMNGECDKNQLALSDSASHKTICTQGTNTSNNEFAVEQEMCGSSAVWAAGDFDVKPEVINSGVYPQGSLAGAILTMPAPPMMQRRKVLGQYAYPCTECSKIFTSSNNLKIHLRTHTGERPYSCSRCEATFIRSDQLTVHMRKHTGIKPYSCTECQASFPQSDKLKIHMRKHTGERPYSCPQCEAAFTRSYDLKIHVRTHTGEKPFICTECQAAFAKSCKLKIHMRIHTGEKPYPCTLCPAAFKQSDKLKIHMRKHTGEKPYACTKCDAAFTQSSDLKVHFRIHTGERPYSCSICEAVFVTSSSLNDHLKRHTGEKRYTCTQCGAVFLRFGELKAHKKEHLSSKSYSCTECDATFTRPDVLTVHMRRHSGVKPFACTECEAAFIKPDKLKVHMRKHTGEKPYTCTDCGEAFRESRSLKVHMRLHSGQNPFVCVKCNATFRRSDCLTVHMKTHANENDTVPVQ